MYFSKSKVPTILVAASFLSACSLDKADPPSFDDAITCASFAKTNANDGEGAIGEPYQDELELSRLWLSYAVQNFNKTKEDVAEAYETGIAEINENYAEMDSIAVTKYVGGLVLRCVDLEVDYEEELEQAGLNGPGL